MHYIPDHDVGKPRIVRILQITEAVLDEIEAYPEKMPGT